MWLLLALAAALFQVLRNTAMKRLGHALDEYINVWGRFTFLLPFALATVLIRGWPAIKPDFIGWCLVFGVSQTISTLALSKALKLSAISLVTALWKVSLLVLLAMGYTIGEQPSALGVVGVLLSAAGVYLLHVSRARASPECPVDGARAALHPAGRSVLRPVGDHHQEGDPGLGRRDGDSGGLRGGQPDHDPRGALYLCPALRGRAAPLEGFPGPGAVRSSDDSEPGCSLYSDPVILRRGGEASGDPLRDGNRDPGVR